VSPRQSPLLGMQSAEELHALTQSQVFVTAHEVAVGSAGKAAPRFKS
jgi:hypothetical protein